MPRQGAVALHAFPLETIDDMWNFERISVDPAQMGGVPCVRHLRIPVATVLRLLAGGRSESEILSDYPDLETEDIRECLRFAAASAMERGADGGRKPRV